MSGSRYGISFELAGGPLRRGTPGPSVDFVSSPRVLPRDADPVMAGRDFAVSDDDGGPRVIAINEASRGATFQAGIQSVSASGRA